MVVFMHPVWDQTKKPERNAVETLVQCGGPSFMMKALRQQKAEEAEAKQKAEEAKRKAAEAEQKAEEAEQKAAKAEQKAAKAERRAEEAERRAEEAERKAEEAERKAAEAPKPGNAAEARPVPGQPGPILTPAITTEPAALLPSHAPTQKTQRRPLEQGLLPERRSLRSQYNVFPFPVAAEYVSSGAFLEPVVSTDALREASQHGAEASQHGAEASQHGAEASQQPETPRRSRPTIVVCVQFGSTHTAGGTAAGDPSIEGDEEARSAYLGEMLYFAKPLSISVAAVTGRSQAGTCAAKNTFSAVLMPTRRASRIPKLNYVLALALPHSPHKELAEAVDASEAFDLAEAVDASEAFDLAEMGKSGADVFVFAPSPFLDTKLTSGGREGRLPDCPVPGYIKLLIPDLSVQDKSIQRKLMVLLVDLSPGAPFGTQPALPTPHPARSLGFDWAALLRLEPKAYKAAAAEQAQQVLQHVLSLTDAS